MAILRFPNLAQTTLTGGGIAIGGPSFTVTAPAAFGASDFIVRVEDAVAGLPAGTAIEFMRVTGVAGSTFTVTKGLGGTADQAHPAGSFCTAVLTHEALTLGLVQQLVGSAELSLSPAAGQGIVTMSVPDSSILTRKLKLENNVTRVYSQQAPGSLAATNAWANYGTAVTITPAANSLILCWVQANVNCDFAGATNVGLKVLFNGGNGVSGGAGLLTISPVTGSKVSLHLLDIFVATAGAVTLQAQMDVGNNSNLTTAGQGLTIFALAIPSS